MPKSRYVTDPELTIMGRRYGADEVALEASEAKARWKRDLPALATFPIKIEDGGVWVDLPPARELEAAANLEEGACRSAAPAAERLLAIPQVKRSSPVVVGVEDGHGG